jgi:RNA polymerase sigma factor (sigma-70 family)
MSTSTVGLFLRHLALSEKVDHLGTASDHTLLAAYEAGHDQAAFTELMRRHGPMVLRTCRRILGRGPDAEDAFQAAFILLARKAGQLRREAAGRLSLGGWLHRVAYQTTLNVLSQSSRRRARERQAGPMSHPDADPVSEATWNEVRPILDAELDALPDQPRRLLIACCLQDKTHAEAAAELGLPLGSVAWRLEKARALLAARLARRGIVVSVPLLAVLLEESARGSGVPAVLLVHSVEVAMKFTEQSCGMVSANVARLVKRALTAQSTTKFHVLLACCLGLAGAGLMTFRALGAHSEARTEAGPEAAQAADQPGQGGEGQAHCDRFGDPLPPRALARLGTVRLRHVRNVHSLAFTRDGTGLITAGEGEPARLWDLATGRLLRQFSGRRLPQDDDRYDQVRAVALSPDGRTLAGRVAEGSLCLWDAATGMVLARPEAKPAGDLVPLVFSPDGKTVASVEHSHDNGWLCLWEVSTGKLL